MKICTASCRRSIMHQFETCLPDTPNQQLLKSTPLHLLLSLHRDLRIFFTKYSISAPVMFDSISFSVNLTNEHLGNKKRTTWARINRSINWFVRAVWTLSPAFERHSNLSIHEQRPISFKVQQIHESPSIEFVNWWPVHLNNWLKTDNLIRAPYMGNSAEVLGG